MTAAKRYTNTEALSAAKKRVTKWKAKQAKQAGSALGTTRRTSGFLKFYRKMACDYEEVPETLDR